MYSNVQSLISKISDLEATVNEINPDLVLLTETWLNTNINNAAIRLVGYEVIPDLRCDRLETAGGIGGGLIVYAKDGLQIIPNTTKSAFHQHCSFSVMTKSERLNFILVYRPPSSGAKNMEELCNLVLTAAAKTILIGDYNVPGVDWNEQRADSKGRSLLEATIVAGMDQLVEGQIGRASCRERV